VIRTDFEDEDAWKAVCELIRAPVHICGDTFYASVDFLENRDLRNLTGEELLTRVPEGYVHSFLFVVDTVTLRSPEFPVLVIDLFAERGRTFRAIPSEIAAIVSNLSIADLSFFEFADEVDEDGVFRGFPGQ